MLGPLSSQLGPLGRALGRQSYVEKVKALAPIAYWPLNETSGTTALDASGNGRNGVHSNVTVGQSGFGDGGGLSAYYDGVAAYTNIYSPSFYAGFNGDVGTIHLWIKVAAADWPSSTAREAIRILPSSFYYVLIRKTSNTLRLFRQSGATQRFRTITVVPTDAWMAIALTWNVATNELFSYVNGVAAGTVSGSILAAWLPTISTTIDTNIGAGNSAAGLWKGYIDDVAIWNRALSASEIAQLAVV